MNTKLKLLFAFLMTIALAFGFSSLYFPDSKLNFTRLHVFLFNLVSGGSIVLYFTEDKGYFSWKGKLFLSLGIVYTLFAFMEMYVLTMITSLALAVIVESVRIKRFSFFPSGFFSKDEPVHLKFHQASLLCLSLGLIISSVVILNNEYLFLVYKPKLQLDTFFLGFSFPLSLITMSMIFTFINKNTEPAISGFKEFGFWSINLGVIIFFSFIIFEKLIPQVFVTTVLFMTVILILYLFYHFGKKIQQKHFLTSGMGFLLITAITGILYIFAEFSPEYTSEKYRWLLRIHSFAALYGWNLCGLAVICRFNDFPIKLHSGKIIFFHWLTVIVIAPLGSYYRIFSIPAVICYALILYFILFSSPGKKI